MEAEQGNLEVDETFDLEATIAEFVRDETRTSLELPRSLSAEQRKVARRLADQHPELKCQSYGIGTERQLHLFKKDVGRAGVPTSIGVIGQDRPPDGGATTAVRVKNTFIDDWVGGEGCTEAEEPLICRSMPAGSAPQSLLERTLQRCLVEGKVDLSPVVEGAGPKSWPEPGAARAEEQPGAASPASLSSSHEAGHVSSSPGSSGPELPALPEGLKVSMRNTFIHIESVPVVERIVQSMPDGMFRQCLAAELTAQHGYCDAGDDSAPLPTSDADMIRQVTAEESMMPVPLSGPLLPPAAPAPLAYAPPGPALATAAPVPGAVGSGPPPPPSEPAQLIALGTEVIIQGLVKLPDFNGLTGVVQWLDPASGRYDVLLSDPAGTSGWKWVKVKGDNLIVKVPPPPSNAPTIPAEVSTPQPPVGEAQVAPAWEEDRAGGKPASALSLSALV